MAIRSLTAVPGILGKLDVFMPNDKVNPYPTLHAKIKSKWIKVCRDIIPKAIKLLQEKI